eukprot:21489-Prymnesium_polylepis.1
MQTDEAAGRTALRAIVVAAGGANANAVASMHIRTAKRRAMSTAARGPVGLAESWAGELRLRPLVAQGNVDRRARGLLFLVGSLPDWLDCAVAESQPSVGPAMADRVRALMEGMVPEFEDLVRRKLCTEHEVKQLIKRREKAEYLLHRREPTRDDFLRAAELEMNLERLIKCRRKRLGLPKKGAADNMVQRR